MAKLAITVAPRAVRNGGPITKDVYKSHATQLWTTGALLKLASGLLQPVVDTSAGGAEIDTDDTGTGVRLFLALENHLTAGSVFVAVQEIKADTELELQLLASSTTDPTTANVSKGSSYVGYQLTGASQVIDGTTYTIHGRGVWGLDVDDTTTPILNITEVSSNSEPFDPDSTDDYATVWAKVLSAVLA